jgi:cytochrome c-type biogenesis protein CcmF
VVAVSFMQEERRGFAIWNMMLVILSFALVLFGTFATRSGIIQSVHAYAQSELGGYFLAGIGVTLIGAFGLVYKRRSLFLSSGSLTQPRHEDTLFSRDGMFFVTVLLLGTLTASVLVGTLLPTITEQFLKQRLSAGPAWFDRVTGPQFAALVLVMGICPFLGRTIQAYQQHRSAATKDCTPSNLYSRYWKWIGSIGAAGALFLAFTILDTTKPLALIGIAITGFTGTLGIVKYIEGAAPHHRTRNTLLNIINLLQTFWHLHRIQKRKYGGYLVHLGVTLMAVGVIGTRMLPFERELTLDQGEPTVVGDYTLVFEALQREVKRDQASVGDHPAQQTIQSVSTGATVSVYRRTLDISEGAYLTTLAPRITQYVNPHTNMPRGQSVTIPALLPRVREDLYLTLAGWTEDESTVALKIVINKLVNFLWLGGLMLLAGGALALWPRHLSRTWDTVILLLGLSALIGAGWAMWGAPPGLDSDFGSGNDGASSPGRQRGRPSVGQTAPDFTLTLLDGTRFSLTDARGQVVVLNFWASWCPPCKDELPALQAVWEAHQPNGEPSATDKRSDVLFIGIAYQEERASVQRTIDEFGITYPVGLDPQERVAERYGITGIPETFIIAPDGRLAYVHIGPITADTLHAQIPSNHD